MLRFDAEQLRDAALRRRDRATSTSASLCVPAPPLRSRPRSQRGPGAVLAAGVFWWRAGVCWWRVGSPAARGALKGRRAAQVCWCLPQEQAAERVHRNAVGQGHGGKVQEVHRGRAPGAATPRVPQLRDGEASERVHSHPVEEGLRRMVQQVQPPARVHVNPNRQPNPATPRTVFDSLPRDHQRWL